MGKKKVAEQSKEQSLKEQTATDQAVAKASSAGSKKAKRLDQGRIYINSSYNNTVITVTDPRGNVIAWATAGSVGFSGPKKATPFAASKIVSVVSEKMKQAGVGEVDVVVKGIGSGRDSAIRSIMNQGFAIRSIKDVTPVPHNGPRPKKVRRV